jgi:hypothetical protein
LTYFFDNNLSFRYANMLRAIRQDVVHIAKTRGFHRDDPDAVWMPKVAAQGWIAVTLDERIRRIAVEEMIHAKAGLRVVFLAEGFLHHSFLDQAKFLINAWPEVLKGTEKSKPGQCFKVTAQKKVVRL